MLKRKSTYGKHGARKMAKMPLFPAVTQVKSTPAVPRTKEQRQEKGEKDEEGQEGVQSRQEREGATNGDFDTQEQYQDDQEEEEGDEEEYVPAAIVAKEIRKLSPDTLSRPCLLVKWEDYDQSDDLTWQLASSIPNGLPHYTVGTSRGDSAEGKKYKITRILAYHKDTRQVLVEWEGFEDVNSLTWEWASVIRKLAPAAFEEYYVAKWELAETDNSGHSADNRGSGTKGMMGHNRTDTEEDAGEKGDVGGQGDTGRKGDAAGKGDTGAEEQLS